MIRLHLIVEGQTEEAFAKMVLMDHLGDFNISTDVRCVKSGRRRGRDYRGGMTTYMKAKGDIERWMKKDHNADARFTTMFDLYRLPGDFPGRASSAHIADPRQKVAALEAAFEQDIGSPRFIPYIQLHEFEALLLSDPTKFESEFIGRDKAIENILEMCKGFDSPEQIDEGDDTAPSKRIISELPEYKGMKASAGPIIARHIGLEKMREKCPHFSDWVGKLESLGS